MEKLSTYEYFNTILKAGSISAAADDLGITQPALSAFLKRLETSVGATLLNRSTNPVTLTDAGEAFARYLENVKMLGRKLSQEIDDLQNLKRGKVVVGGAIFFNVAYLPAAVAEFNQLYPGIDIEIVDGKIPEITADALAGKIDVFTTPVKGHDEDFCYEEMFNEKIFLCTPPGWELNKKLPKPDASGYAVLNDEDFDLLKDCTFITLHDDQDIGRKMHAVFDKHDFTPKHTVIGGQTLTTLDLTLSGVGISMISESTLQNYKLQEKPGIYLIDPEICSRSMYIAYPKNQYVSQATKEFIRVLLKHNK